MIARSDSLSELEQLVALLSRCADRPCIAPLMHDIEEIARLLSYYSFRTPQLADRFAALLHDRYRFEIYSLYGGTGSPLRGTGSSYLELQQLLGQLIRVALARLCCDGVYTLTRSQLTQSDGLLLLTLKNARMHPAT